MGDGGQMDLSPCWSKWWNHGNSCWVSSFPSFSTGLNRHQRPDVSALVPAIGSLAVILCFLVARGSVCPAFHCENHLEVFVLKNAKS